MENHHPLSIPDSFLDHSTMNSTERNPVLERETLVTTTALTNTGSRNGSAGSGLSGGSGGGGGGGGASPSSNPNILRVS